MSEYIDDPVLSDSQNEIIRLRTRLAEVEAGVESAHEGLRDLLGARACESVFDAANRVARERDVAVFNLPKVELERDELKRLLAIEAENRQRHFEALARAKRSEAKVTALEAERDVLRGVDCLVNGDGPCGVCVKCLRLRAETAEKGILRTARTLRDEGVACLGRPDRCDESSPCGACFLFAAAFAIAVDKPLAKRAPKPLTKETAAKEYRRIYKKLKRLRGAAADFISRKDNNAMFELARYFRDVAKRIESGYENHDYHTPYDRS